MSSASCLMSSNVNCSILAQDLEKPFPSRIEGFLSGVSLGQRLKVVRSRFERPQAGILGNHPVWVIAVLQETGGRVKNLGIHLEGQKRSPLGLFQPAGNGLPPVEAIGTFGHGSVVNPINIPGVRVEQVPLGHPLLSDDAFKLFQILRGHESIQICGVVHPLEVR